jgi:hypothetical protein
MHQDDGQDHEFNNIESIVNSPEKLREKLVGVDERINKIYDQDGDFKDHNECAAEVKKINDFLFKVYNYFKSEILEILISRSVNLEIYLLGLIKNINEEYFKERISEIDSKIGHLNDFRKRNEIENKISILKKLEAVIQSDCVLYKEASNEDMENILKKSDLLRIKLAEISRLKSFSERLLAHIDNLEEEYKKRVLLEAHESIKKSNDFLFKIHKNLKSEVVENTIYSNLKTELNYLKLIRDFDNEHFKNRVEDILKEFESKEKDYFLNVKEKDEVVESLKEMICCQGLEEKTQKQSLEYYYKIIKKYEDIIITGKTTPLWTLKLCYKGVKEFLDKIYEEIKISNLLEFYNNTPNNVEFNRKMNLKKGKLDAALKGTKLIIDIIDRIRNEQNNNNVILNLEIYSTKNVYKIFQQILEHFKNYS